MTSWPRSPPTSILLQTGWQSMSHRLEPSLALEDRPRSLSCSQLNIIPSGFYGPAPHQFRPPRPLASPRPRVGRWVFFGGRFPLSFLASTLVVVTSAFRFRRAARCAIKSRSVSPPQGAFAMKENRGSSSTPVVLPTLLVVRSVATKP